MNDAGPYRVATPQVASQPEHVPLRLIDRGLLLYEASAAGAAERYGRQATPHTVHVWWARRPHAAMRALAFAALAPDSERSHAIMNALALSGAAASPSLDEARAVVRASYDGAPRVLDMFSGGGTIPFACASLGASAYALDVNELSVFSQRALFVYSRALAKHPALIEQAAERILGRLHEATAPLFPGRPEVCTYLWSYAYRCASCGYSFYLSKRPYLSKKPGRRVLLTVSRGSSRDQLSITDDARHTPERSAWRGRSGHATCPKCGDRTPRIALADCREEQVAAIVLGDQGKRFRLASTGDMPSAQTLQALEASALAALDTRMPTSELPRWSGIVNPALYGMSTHAEVVNPRQRLVLLMLLGELKREYHALCAAHGQDIALGVIALLSGLVDQSIDWNCRLSMWIPQNEQVGRALCGPGVAMLWDYAETDPTGPGPSNLWAKAKRIAAGARSLSQLSGTCEVTHGRAQALPYPDGFFDAIVTDPPYYDNLVYSMLADFVYAWKRLLFQDIEDKLFAGETTRAAEELVALSARTSGDADAAHAGYCDELARALAEAERVLKHDGVLTLIYSHRSLRGWEALIRAYRGSSLVVTSVQPLSIERRHRPRAMTSEAVHTCVVFVARRSSGGVRVPLTQRELLARLEGDQVRSLIASLRQAGWREDDMALTYYAQGVGLLMNAVLSDSDDEAALLAVEAAVKGEFPQFALAKRRAM